MRARLFADLMPEHPRRRPGAFPVSLALPGLAIAALASLAARPVAVEMPAPSASGPIVFAPAPLRTASGTALPPRLKAPQARPQPTAPGPAPVLDHASVAASAVSDDLPSPCLRDCGIGDDLGSNTPGSGFLTPDIGGSAPGGSGGPPLRVGGNIRAPLKLHDVAPVYPELARRARVQGLVIISCVIDADGRVAEAAVLRGVPLLDTAALEAVRQWTYRPTLLNGSPVAVVMTVTVQFTLRR